MFVTIEMEIDVPETFRFIVGDNGWVIDLSYDRLRLLMSDT